jgi:LURP-one-related
MIVPGVAGLAQQFRVPLGDARSLDAVLGGQRMYLIRERFFRLGEDSDITDDQGRPVLHVDGKVMSLHNRLVLRDPAGQEVAQVYRKLVALRPTFEVSVGGAEAAEIRSTSSPRSGTGSRSTSPAPTTSR